MAQQAQILLSPLIAKKIKEKADLEMIPPEEVVNIYLLYCLVHHKKVIEFERQVGNDFIEGADRQRASQRNNEQQESGKPARIPNGLLHWLRSNGLKSPRGTSPTNLSDEQTASEGTQSNGSSGVSDSKDRGSVGEDEG